MATPTEGVRTPHGAPSVFEVTAKKADGPVERAERELERAAGVLVDQWALIEVGGDVRREDRRSAERRLMRAVATLRSLRPGGGQ